MLIEIALMCAYVFIGIVTLAVLRSCEGIQDFNEEDVGLNFSVVLAWPVAWFFGSILALYWASMKGSDLLIKVFEALKPSKSEKSSR